MIILAIYYTLADVVLLWQCLVYGHGDSSPDYVHLSPANPMNEDVLETVLSRPEESEQQEGANIDEESQISKSDSLSPLMTTLYKSLMVLLVISAGLIGWYISYLKDANKKHHKKPQDLVYDPLAQFFAGSFGTLALDFTIFIQFFLYNENENYDNYNESDCDSCSANEITNTSGPSRTKKNGGTLEERRLLNGDAVSSDNNHAYGSTN
ncbi:hypothetical protein QCA50_019468 [Cerrena zonata]|uniref:Uncharacterized protein n=1 Tax=Cerrena zonata TaxID=2478898 RepID=A0AAW0FHF1_9APHY